MASKERRPARRVDRDLQAIGALTQAVVDGDDLEQLLGRIAAEARTLVGAVSGVVVTVAGTPSIITFRAVDGLSVGPLRVGFEMPVVDTLTELALKRGANIVARDAGEIPPSGRAFAAAINVGPLIAAPLAQIGSARGVLVVARLDGSPPFRPADIHLVSTFASQAASAIELFELRSAETIVAVRTERARIARDLNDRVVQALGDVELSVRALATGTADRRLVAGIDDAVGQLDDAIATVRTYVVELETPPILEPSPPRVRRASGASLPWQQNGDAPQSGHGRGSRSTIEAIGELAIVSATESAADDVLQFLVDGLVEALHGGSALIGLLTEDGANVRVKTRAGPVVPGRQVGDVIPIAETVAGQAITRGRPLVLSSMADASPSIPLAVRQATGPLVAVPLAVRGRTFGTLVIARPIGANAFSAAEVRVIEAYAVQATVALEFERVRLELRQGSVSAERDRIGRDLQERVIQLLFGVALTLQALESTVTDPSTRASLQATVEGLDRAIRDLRRFVFGLGPSSPVGHVVDERLDALAAENARLQAEIEAQLHEVRASRTRIVAAGDAERKRLERNLHDGAQQRLVSLTLALRLARTSLGDSLDPSARLSLDQASEEAKAALSELRELARGIHPQILTEAGLGAAVESLAQRSPVDVSVEIRAERFSPAIEGAAYFTVSEALANVAKYAQASRALVRAEWQDDHLTVEIVDDGVGGADPATGSGLRGLADRLSAINGTLEIVSPSGGGTRLVARIPASTPATVPL